MFVYHRLKDTREDADKKQDDIARVLGITRQQYQLYESGKREMPMHLLSPWQNTITFPLIILRGLLKLRGSWGRVTFT